MSEASVWRILKDFSVGIPRQDKVLTYFFNSWIMSVWIEDHRGELSCNISKSGCHFLLRYLWNSEI